MNLCQMKLKKETRYNWKYEVQRKRGVIYDGNKKFVR